MEKFKAVIYCRLSKDDGNSTESNSIINQKQLCRDYVNKQSDIELAYPDIVDDGFSGTNFERNGLIELEKIIEDKIINCVIVKDLSRFGRDYLKVGDYLQKLFPMKGIRFIAINDSYDSFKSDLYIDGFMLPIRNLINDMYCQDISTKIRSSLDVKRKKGQYVGAFVPYGYKKSENDKNKIIVDENIRENIMMIFSYFQSGKSIQEIVEICNKLELLTPLNYKLTQDTNFKSPFNMDNNIWNYNMVKRILTNEIYTGNMVQGKRTTPNHKVKKISTQSSNKWIKVEDTHEAIISKVDFIAINDLLKRDMRNTKNENSNHLSGYLFCADCGATMHKKNVKSKGNTYVYYVCSEHKKKKNCSWHNISEKIIYKELLQAIQKQINIYIEYNHIISNAKISELTNLRNIQMQKQLEIIECSIKELEEKIFVLYQDYTDSLIDREEYILYKHHYEAQLLEKKECRDRMKNQSDKNDDLLNNEREWVGKFIELKNIENIDRRVLLALVDKVKIHTKHKIEIVFKFNDFYEDVIKKYKGGKCDG